MSIAQFTPGATPNGDGQGGKMVDTNFAEMLLRYTGIGPVDWGAACMAHAVVVDGLAAKIAQAEKRLTITSLHLSRHQANEDRLLAWLDEYMHDNALDTNPDHDLAGAVIDVFKQQQRTIQLLRYALDAQPAKVQPSIAEKPAVDDRSPAEFEADDDFRPRCIAELRRLATGNKAPTQQEWDELRDDLPDASNMLAILHTSWSDLIAQAGLSRKGGRPSGATKQARRDSASTAMAELLEEHKAAGAEPVDDSERYANKLEAYSTHTTVRQATTPAGDPVRVVATHYMLR